MAEKVTIGNCELYHGDCREVLPLLPDFDLLLTDPPYEIGTAWHGDFAGKNGKAAMWGTAPEWDKLCDDGVSLGVQKAREAVVWGGHLYALPQRSRWLSWDKCQTFSSGDFELAWTNGSGATRVFRMSRIDAYQNSGEGKEHPTQKPTALMEWCLSLHQKARTVCDPFMGSGTTGVACARMGLQFVGIERERKYFDIACRRIEQAYAQPRLFEDAKVGAGDTAVQGDMLLPANVEVTGAARLYRAASVWTAGLEIRAQPNEQAALIAYCSEH